MAIYAAIGPAEFFITLVPLALVAFFFIAGFVAHENDKPAPYWSSVGSVVIFFFFVLPLFTFRPIGTNAIFFACFFSIGGYLSYSAIRHGHWMTRILGVFVIAAYALGFCVIAQYAIFNWDDVVNHWLN